MEERIKILGLKIIQGVGCVYHLEVVSFGEVVWQELDIHKNTYTHTYKPMLA